MEAANHCLYNLQITNIGKNCKQQDHFTKEYGSYFSPTYKGGEHKNYKTQFTTYKR